MSLRRNTSAAIHVWKRAMAGVGLASVLSIAGCAVGPKYNAAVQVPPAYKEAGIGSPPSPTIRIWAGPGGRSFRTRN